jgi:ABC-type antimicrobial peptide transport system permease subunit
LRDDAGMSRVETDLGVVAAGIVASSGDRAEPFGIEVLALSRFDSWDEAAGIALIPVLVFGVAAVPFATLGGSAALLAAAMLIASILPARRAARMNPNVLLRE